MANPLVTDDYRMEIWDRAGVARFDRLEPPVEWAARCHGRRTSTEEGLVAKEPRDVERIQSTEEFVVKLRRLADALESGRSFRIQVAGERFRVPARAVFSVEHERGDGEEEVEFQLRWDTATADADEEDAPTEV